MKIGKPITTVTSPKRNVRKANEPKQDPRIEPIPVEMPAKKKKKVEVEVDAHLDFRFYGWGYARMVSPNPYILTSVV